MKLRRFNNPSTGLVHHYSMPIPRDDRMEAYLAGYEKAGAQYREGKQIRPLNVFGRIVFTAFVFVAFAAVALVATWIVP
jgi:hypothetical protein